MELYDAIAMTAPAATPCVVARALHSLDEAQRPELEALLSNADWPHARLARVLSLMTGAKVHQDAMGKHRRDRCCCGA